MSPGQLDPSRSHETSVGCCSLRMKSKSSVVAVITQAALRRKVGVLVALPGPGDRGQVNYEVD
jgi:hypothetical protein